MDKILTSFKLFINELIDYAKNAQDKPEEYINHEDALKACYYITHIEPKKIGDLLLYCVSLSLMNRYVKQDDSIFHNNYLFKSNGLIRLMEVLPSDNKIEGFEMMFDVDKDKGNSTLLYTSVCGMHFSFHSVSKHLKEIMPKIYEANFEWDEIKKQICASTLFHMVESNDLFFSESGYNTNNIKESAAIIANQYIKGEISLRKFRNVCNFYVYSKKNNYGKKE